MKKLVILMAAFVFAACSSAPKEETTTSDVEKKVIEATDTTTTSTATTEVKEAKKTSKKAKETAAAAETTTAATTTSDFPAINGTEKSSVTCTNKSDSRKISVMNVTEGGCGVVYNKMGEDKTVALAKADLNYCDSVSTKIKTNLEGAGFNCGGGSAAGTSTDSGTGNQ